MRRLHRSESDRMLCGVCSGLGDYLDVDPTLVRLVWVAAILFGGCGLLLYVIAAIVIPTESRLGAAPFDAAVETGPAEAPAAEAPSKPRRRSRKS